jgi:hypothetical protein
MNPPPDRTDPPAVPAQYEFDAHQNRMIDDLASAMVWVGVPLMVLAILYGLTAVLHFAQSGRDVRELLVGGIVLLVAIFFYLLASWLRQAAAAFNRVIHTSGFDITHLMDGLQSLRKLFRLLAVLVQIYLALLAILLISFVVIAVTRA